MPPVTFVRGGRPDTLIETAVGTSLLETARSAGLPLASSCRGAGICDACRVRILEGMDNLNPRNEREAAQRLALDERLACQACPRGPVSITTSYW